MVLYIEKKVLYQLNLDFLKDDLVLGQQIMRDMLYFYDGLTFYTDLSFNDKIFDLYKKENLLFTKIVEKNTPFSMTLEEFIITNNFKQTIVFAFTENYKHRDAIESKGGLYFTHEKYSNAIETILNHFHKRIDLSEKFEGWPKIFTNNSLKLNEIIINDNYLLDSIANIETYIKPLVNAVKKQSNLDRLLFITDYLNKNNFDKENKEEDLKTIFNSSIEIIHNNFNNFSNHDRILYTNFLMIECPIGFNQVHKVSNSVITIYTIFDKFTYKRRRKHYDAIEKSLKN